MTLTGPAKDLAEARDLARQRRLEADGFRWLEWFQNESEAAETDTNEREETE